MKTLRSLLTLSLLNTFLLGAAPNPDLLKFTFDGEKQSHPVTLELQSVEYMAKGMELEFKVINNSTVGIDFSKAKWVVNSGNREGYIKESQFDGMVLYPKTKRLAKITFGFDQISTPSFLKERYNGTSIIQIENIQNFQNKKIAPIVLKNY